MILKITHDSVIHIKDKYGVCFSVLSAFSVSLLLNLANASFYCNMKNIAYCDERLVVLEADNLSGVSDSNSDNCSDNDSDRKLFYC